MKLAMDMSGRTAVMLKPSQPAFQLRATVSIVVRQLRCSNECAPADTWCLATSQTVFSPGI